MRLICSQKFGAGTRTRALTYWLWKNPQGPFQIVTKTSFTGSQVLVPWLVPGQGVLFPRMVPVHSQWNQRKSARLPRVAHSLDWHQLLCLLPSIAWVLLSGLATAWRELNDVQCVNGIPQHPFSWLRSWPGWSQGYDAEMNKDVLSFPRDRGSGIWRLSLGWSTVLSIGWESGEDATNLELSSLGVEGAAGLRFFFLCVLFFFFFFSGHATHGRILTLGPGTESGWWPVKVLSLTTPDCQGILWAQIGGDARANRKIREQAFVGDEVEGDSGRMLAQQPLASPALHPHW